MFRRRARLGLLTVLGLARRGYFIPYRFAESLPAPGRVPAYPALAALFKQAEPAFADTLAAIEAVADDLRAIGKAPSPAPRWTQDWFPTLDAAAAYALVRRHRPGCIVEVGSGHSTRFLKRAVDDGGLPTRLVAIDPAPRRGVEQLDLELHRAPLHAVGEAPFRALGPGDMLVIDSSHILMPGSDVDDLMNRILPALPDGVLVHIHDVFLPDDYPPAWAWRNYNEQQGVAILLLSGAYTPLFASHYVNTRMASQLSQGVLAELPKVAEAHPASLWLRKA